MLAMRLAVLHNLHFYNELTSRIREALEQGAFADFRGGIFGKINKTHIKGLVFSPGTGYNIFHQPFGGTIMDTLYTLIPLVLIIAVFYFFMIRPENKKKKKAAEMRANLKVGDMITTIGGVIGTVCAVKDDTIVIETGADRVRIEFTKWAISTVGAQTNENAK